MWGNSGDLFSQICSKVSNKLYFEQLMIKQQQFFDIQPYKIDKLYSEPAKKLYKQISFKYQVTKQLAPNPNLWHQNQRKIFIWFIVCYFHQIRAQDPLQITVDWQSFSQIFFSKSCSFLKFQFLNIIKLKKRIIWTTEQDALLAKATEQQGIGKWNEISKALFFNSDGLIFKSPKHCRQRWLNHLDTNKNKGKWTDEEDYKILLYVKEYGKKWSKIVQVLNNTRTEHMIKNRFNSLLTKNRKNKKQKQLQTVNKIVKTLQKTVMGQTYINHEQKLNPDAQRTVLVQLQSDDQSSQNNSSDNFILKNQNNKSEKEEILTKRSFESKPSFEMSNFETSAFFMSFNTVIENHFIKDQQEKLTVNSRSNFFYANPISKLHHLSSEKDLSENLRGGTNKLNCIKNSEKSVYKVKPVYIIQLNA